VFTDGTELDRYFETNEGVIWVSALVHIRSGTLFLNRLLIYPTTGANLQIGVHHMLSIVRSLREEAIAQGLTSFSVEADRVYLDKPERMILINRRLR
jgi:hypothetical protein